MAVQQFCLRWNNHQPNFISVFTDLLNNETLVDVTLAAEGKQLQAHKVVLSACSTYFQSLFTSNPCQHPIVILKDIRYNDLKTMVDFMYYGEVNVSQDQLPAILKTAETLKVKGLAEMPEGVSFSKSESQGSESPWSPGALRRKRLRKSSTGSSEQTSTEDAAGSVGSGGTIAPSPSVVKTEPNEPARDPSTESDTARSQSFDTDDQTPNTPTRTLSEDLNDSNIRWSSTEEQAKSHIQMQPTSTGSEVNTNTTMGVKRGRLLMRQSRIKKESECSAAPSGGPDDNETSSGNATTVLATISGSVPRIERHSSEPGPHHLTVPSAHHYLPKQNSSPHLNSLNSSVLSGSQSHPSTPHVHITPPTPTTPPRPITPPSITPSSGPEIHSRHEGRRTAPIPQGNETVAGNSSHSGVATASSNLPLPGSNFSGLSALAPSNTSGTTIVQEGQSESRACHCPALRPGPALGCNFCWNTIDNHGRILRRKTKYHCPDCQTNLCIVPCFQEYHERQSSSGAGSSGGTSSGSSGGPAGPSKESPSSSGNNNSTAYLTSVGFPTIMKTSSL